MDPAVGDALAAMGHRVRWGGEFDSAFGHEHAVEFVWGDPGAGEGRTGPESYAATADPRSDGLPAAC
jgi:hypothetical protein